MKSRKTDHLRICVEEDVEAGDPGFELIRLRSLSSPEADLDSVDTSTEFLGKKLDFPLIFEAITGGTPEAGEINKGLASVAQEYGVGMGVGSQRAAIEDSSLEDTFKVRDVAPDILLIGNLGAVQLNNGYGLEECEKAVEMIDADALALHFNALQEAVQPEGDTNFKGTVAAVNKIAGKLKASVIAKEVGCGLDYDTASRLKVDAYDCGGSGGTSWSLVESYRSELMKDVGVTYASWGLSTVESVMELAKLGKPLIASGGVRTGLDAAKCIALGADVVGVALPVLRAYVSGEDTLKKYLDRFIREFRAAMYLTGSGTLKDLKGKAE